MNIHFIAIGGAAMHSLALALLSKGFKISGSDDEIQEPSRSRLLAAGILPEKAGWFPAKIHQQLDAVILGMHARTDNPELLEAKRLGLKIYSYPEYLYEHSKNKKRIVIGGSHGKTTITAMILHVMKLLKHDFDYMAGSALPGFENMVKLSDAPVIVLEGDEYLSSPIDLRPKFHLYHPHVAVVSGIAWDHINVFPTFENYTEQFSIFIQKIEPGGVLIYCNEDELLKQLVTQAKPSVHRVAYAAPESVIKDGITYLISDDGYNYPLGVFGHHNLLNLEAARLVCEQCAISRVEFYQAISSFKGAARRLEKVFANDNFSVFRDFAHSPSKLKATIGAVKTQSVQRKVVACMELHTFSSLNINFLTEYAGSMDEADIAVVYFSPQTISHKKLKPVSEEQVREAFGRKNLFVFSNSARLSEFLQTLDYRNTVLLLMSSGTFNGLDVTALIKLITRSVGKAEA
ncbi:MAG: Mur ligase domain-containing protein [Bacteroidia bacterium]|nr:peptidoglycan synthetase [Bacteroidia bacterium]MCZ2277458.1 Mur ligase domain-containing protein [Bacteroidia bacterium]